MLRWKIGVINFLLLCSCKEGMKHIDEKVGVGQNRPELLRAVSPAERFSGLYVQHYSGGNSHSYRISYEHGHYVGEYTEIQEGNESVTKLEEVQVDTATRNVILKMNGTVSKAQFTSEGLMVNNDGFPFKKME